MYIDEEFLAKVGLSSKEKITRVGYTSEPTSELVIERVCAGKTDVFRGGQKILGQKKSQEKPVLVIADWSYNCMDLSHRQADINLFSYLLKNNYTLYVWTESGPLLCNTIKKLKQNVVNIPYNDKETIKPHVTAKIGDCQIIDYRRMKKILSQIKYKGRSWSWQIYLPKDWQYDNSLHNSSGGIRRIYLEHFNLDKEATRKKLLQWTKTHWSKKTEPLEDHTLFIFRSSTLQAILKYRELQEMLVNVKNLNIKLSHKETIELKFSDFIAILSNCKKLYSFSSHGVRLTPSIDEIDTELEINPKLKLFEMNAGITTFKQLQTLLSVFANLRSLELPESHELLEDIKRTYGDLDIKPYNSVQFVSLLNSRIDATYQGACQWLQQSVFPAAARLQMLHTDFGMTISPYLSIEISSYRGRCLKFTSPPYRYIEELITEVSKYPEVSSIDVKRMNDQDWIGSNGKSPEIRLTKISKLEIENAPLFIDDFEILFAATPELTTLTIENCPNYFLTRDQSSPWYNTGIHSDSIVYLKIKNTTTVKSTINIFSLLSAYPKLYNLDLRGTYLELEAQPEFLAKHLNQFPKLGALIFPDTILAPSTLELIIKSAPNLRAVEILVNKDYLFDDTFYSQFFGKYTKLKNLTILTGEEDVTQFLKQCKQIFPNAQITVQRTIGESVKSPQKTTNTKIVPTFNNEAPKKSRLRSRRDNNVSKLRTKPKGSQKKAANSQFLATKHKAKKVDIDTEDKHKKFECHQYFLGKNANRVTHYRLSVKLPPAAALNKPEYRTEEILFTETTDAFAIYKKSPTKPPLLKKIKSLFTSVEKPDPVYLCEVNFQLSQQWNSLPSYYPYEKLTHLECRYKTKIIYQGSEGLYYIKHADPEAEPICTTIRFVFTAYNLKLSNEFVLACLDDPLNKHDIDLISSLQIDRHFCLVHNEASAYFETMSDLQKILTIRDYIDYFTPGELHSVKNIEPDYKKINEIFKHRKGACRHRALAGFIFLNALGILTRNPSNQAHSFCEVLYDGYWRTLNLGGAPGGVSIISKPHCDKKQDLIAAKPNNPSIADSIDHTEQFEDLSETEYFKDIDIPLLSDHHVPILPPITASCPNEITLVDNAVNWFIENTSLQSSTKGNILLVLPDANQLIEFVYQLQHILTMRQHNSFYVDDLDQVYTKALQADQGRYEIVNSELINFFNSPGVFITNWSDFNPEFTGLNSIFVDNPTIKGHKIPSHINKIAVITRIGLMNYQDDFHSRFTSIIEFPRLGTAKQKLSSVEQKESAKTVEIQLSNKEWRVKLLGRLVFKGHNAIYKPGELVRVLKQHTKDPIDHIVFVNPPYHDNEFERFYSKLDITRVFFCNGISHRIDAHIVFSCIDRSPECINTVVTYEAYNQESPQLWQSILNKDTLELFYRRYQVADGCMNEIGGLISENSNSKLRVLVTQYLDSDQWFELLTEAKKNNCELHLIVMPNVFLGSYLANQVEYAESETVTDKQSRHQLILTNDADYAGHRIYQNNPENTVVIPVSEATEASQLIGYTSVVERNNRLIFSYHEGPLKTLLEDGKIVVLTGQLSDSLTTALATLWSEQPHLWCNGEKFSPKGQCILVTENTSHPLLPVSDKIVWSGKLDSFSSEQCYLRALSHMDYCEVKYHVNLIKLTNLSPSYLPKVQSCDDFDQTRLSRVMNILQHQPCMFMLGKTGSGKSTLFRRFIKGYEGLKQLSAWATHKSNNEDFIILFIDEANLLSKQMLTVFEGLYSSTPGILHNGHWYPLSPQHKVIFAGNPLGYGGRSIHKLWENRVFSDVFNTLPPWYVKERIIQPTLISLGISERPRQIACEIFTSVYEVLYTSDLLTPRNCIQMIFNFRIALESSTEEKNLETIVKYCAYNEAYRVIKDDKNRIHWIKRVLEVTGGIPEKIQTPFSTSHFELYVQRKNQVFAPEHTPVLRALDKHIRIRQIKIDTAEVSDIGSCGLIIEGLSGIGKSTVAMNYLKFLGFNSASRSEENQHSQRCFYVLSSADFDDIERLLYKAFHEGAVVIIDELNTFNYSVDSVLNIERLLNTYISGTDLNGSNARYPGFMVIGTQNPAGKYRGRAKESSAINNRLEKIQMNDFNKSTLVNIAMQLGCHKQLALILVAEHHELLMNELVEASAFVRNPRTFIAGIRALTEHKASNVQGLPMPDQTHLHQPLRSVYKI